MVDQAWSPSTAQLLGSGVMLAASAAFALLRQDSFYSEVVTSVTERVQYERIEPIWLGLSTQTVMDWRDESHDIYTSELNAGSVLVYTAATVALADLMGSAAKICVSSKGRALARSVAQQWSNLVTGKKDYSHVDAELEPHID